MLPHPSSSQSMALPTPSSRESTVSQDVPLQVFAETVLLSPGQRVKKKPSSGPEAEEQLAVCVPVPEVTPEYVPLAVMRVKSPFPVSAACQRSWMFPLVVDEKKACTAM